MGTLKKPIKIYYGFEGELILAGKNRAKKLTQRKAPTSPKENDKESPKMYFISVGDSLVSFARKVADKELRERISKST